MTEDVFRKMVSLDQYMLLEARLEAALSALSEISAGDESHAARIAGRGLRAASITDAAPDWICDKHYIAGNGEFACPRCARRASDNGKDRETAQ